MSAFDPQNVRGRTIRVSVRDASRMSTQLLADVLRKDRRFEVVNAGDTAESFAAAGIQVAVLCCDPEGDNLQLVRQLHAIQPDLKVVALMDDPQPWAVLQAFRAGVRGIFCRSDSYKNLAKCVAKVHGGHVWASQAQLLLLIEALGQPFPLTLVDAKGSALLSPREGHVVHCVAEGLTNREIADRIHLSEHTVKNYLFRIFDKLGVSSRAELVLYALSHLPGSDEIAKNGENRDEFSNVSTGDSHSEVCPLAQYQRGQERRQGAPGLTSYEAAYLYFSIAEAVSATLVERSRAALRDLANSIPASRLHQLETVLEERLQNAAKALAEGRESVRPPRSRVA